MLFRFGAMSWSVVVPNVVVAVLVLSDRWLRWGAPKRTEKPAKRSSDRIDLILARQGGSTDSFSKEEEEEGEGEDGPFLIVFINARIISPRLRVPILVDEVTMLVARVPVASLAAEIFPSSPPSISWSLCHVVVSLKFVMTPNKPSFRIAAHIPLPRTSIPEIKDHLIGLVDDGTMTADDDDEGIGSSRFPAFLSFVHPRPGLSSGERRGPCSTSSASLSLPIEWT